MGGIAMDHIDMRTGGDGRRLAMVWPFGIKASDTDVVLVCLK